MTKMRIAQVIAGTSPILGGPAFVVVGTARALARRGHEVHLLSTDRGGSASIGDELAKDGVRFKEFKEVMSSSGWSPDFSREVSSLIPSMDVVHAHGVYLHPVIASALTCQRSGVPYVVRPAGTFDPYHVNRKRFKKSIFNWVVGDRAMRGAAAFHFTTQIEQEISQPYIFGRPSFVVPNGLDLTQQTSSTETGSLRSRFKEIGDRKIILSLGRINYKKGFEVLIPAFAELIRKRDDSHLVIAGNDDGHLATVKRLIAEYHVGDRTTLAGFLGGEDKIAAYAESYVFVLPSYSENFANALFEAMMAGTPAIVSDKVNSWPEVTAAGAGSVVEPKVEALAKELDLLLSNPARRDKMAACASQFARDNYSWDSVAQRLEENYEAIITKHRR